MSKMPDRQISEHGFVVLAERCTECLYGKDKIVPNERRKQLLTGLEKDDNFFICHKATMQNRVVACAGDYEQRGCGKLGRLAEHLGILKRMPESEIHTLPEVEDEDADHD